MSRPALVESIFFAALEKKTMAERADYLDKACGADAALRLRVERLLDAHPKAEHYLAQPAVDRHAFDPHNAARDANGLASTCRSESISQNPSAGDDLFETLADEHGKTGTAPAAADATIEQTRHPAQPTERATSDGAKGDLPGGAAARDIGDHEIQSELDIGGMGGGDLAGQESLNAPVGPQHGAPSKIGRHRIIRQLGQGGFGLVYLAHDDDLDRPVAIKVPNPERISSPDDVEAFFVEARVLARLDHPHIITAGGLSTWNRVDRNRRELLAQKAREQEAIRIEGLVGRLVSAEPNQLPVIVKELDANPEVAATYLSPLLAANARTVDEKRAQLHARVAMVSRDRALVEPLLEELLTNKVVYVGPIRQQLRPYAGALTERLRAILRDGKAEAIRRFRAAVALSDYVPESEAASWTEQDLKFVAEQLVSSNAEFQPLLRDALRPIGARLLGDMERIFADARATVAQQLSAANAFADYAAGDIPKLSQLLTVATPEQFAVLYPIVAAGPAPATIKDLARIAATPPSVELGSVERIPFGQRRANAAVTLLRLGEREKVLPVFEMTDDPEALTQFIFRCRTRGVAVDALLDCLQRVSAAPKDRYPKSTRYALLLSLGEFSIEEIPESRRRALLEQLAGWYRHDPSSGVHGATGWLLRQWGQAEVARQVDHTAVPYAPDREWFTQAITVTPAPAEKAKLEPPALPLSTKTFYFTFVEFPAGAYDIGSVNDEADRKKNEVRHRTKLTRRFALLDREITLLELIAFSPQYAGLMRNSDAKPADAGFGANWYDAVGFCRWLGQQSGVSEGDQSYAAPETLDKAKYPREPNPAANWAPRNWPLELGRRGFRLPTESEWEVASRAGARTPYGFGGEVSLLRRSGWFAENSGKHVHPPRELRPSIRGLSDLYGNVFEWCHDWFGDYGVDAIADPLGAKEGSLRVIRGGSWSNDAASCRSAYRNPSDPPYRSNSIGFRLALSLPGVLPGMASVTGAEPAGAGTEGAPADQRPANP